MYEVLYLNIDDKALLAALNDSSLFANTNPSFIIFSLAEDVNAALFTNAAEFCKHISTEAAFIHSWYRVVLMCFCSPLSK